VGGHERFVGYCKNSGEFIGHYLAWLKEWAGERRACFGGHFVPHDGDRESLWLEGGTKGLMSSLGFHPTIVERPRSKGAAIAAARAAFARCPFDEQGCDLGLRRLRAYRKEWDETRGVWKDRPRLARGRRLPDLRLLRLQAALAPSDQEAELRMGGLIDIAGADLPTEERVRSGAF
jgi:hypothetical protein